MISDFRRTGLLLVLAILPIAGCHARAELPKTYPVRGKVVFRDGEPMTGGTIQFQSEEKPRVAASSIIAADGTFELSSFVAGARAPGAVPGRHRVIVLPPVSINDVDPIWYAIPPQQASVCEGDNRLTITIEKPHRTDLQSLK